MVTVAAAMLLTAGLAWAAPVLDEVGKGKDAWQRKLQACQQECEAAKKEVLVRYRKALDNMRQSVQQNGDLEGVTAMDVEIHRFDAKNDLPGMAATEQMPALVRTIVQAREAWGKAELEGARKTQDYTEQYVLALDQRIKQAVRDNHLDLAKAFDGERKSARDAPAYQAAKFLLAEKEAESAKGALTGMVSVVDTKLTKPASSNLAPSFVLGPDRPGRNGQVLTPRTDPEGLYDALQVGEGGQSFPPGMVPVAYKPLPVSETGKVPRFDSVGITAEGCTDADTDAGRYHLRFRVRVKSLSTTYTNLKVLAQYFVRNPNGTGIREAQVYFVLVTNLSAKGVFCEMKPAELPYSYISRGRGLGAAERNRNGTAASAEDREPAFAGVVISVYATDDKLLGQVTSSTSLKERGKGAFQLPLPWMQRVRERPGK